jgi:thiazole synthase ThiGH ThiG subunit
MAIIGIVDKTYIIIVIMADANLPVIIDMGFIGVVSIISSV